MGQVALDANGSPVVVTTGENKRRGGVNLKNVLGSALLGGGAGYAANRFWLDPMNEGSFADALRNGGEINYTTPLTRSEQSRLATVRKKTGALDIAGIFGKKDEISLGDYFHKRGISGARGLQHDIAGSEKKLDPDKKGSLAKQTEQAETQIEHVNALIEQSDALSDIDEEIASLQKEIKSAKGKNNSPKGLNQELERLQKRRVKTAEKLEKLMGKHSEIIDFSKIKAKNGEPIFGSIKEVAAGTTDKRKKFFEKLLGIREKGKQSILDQIAKEEETLAARQLDLGLVEAAKSSGKKKISRQAASEASERLGSELKLGTKEIGELFGKFKGKLPKIQNLKRAGIVGAAVGLGLLLFSSSDN